MKKLLLFLGVVGMLCISSLFIDAAGRRPSPSEQDWLVDIYTYTFTSSSGSNDISTRSGRFIFPSNTITAVVTNAGITTNSVIFAALETADLTNTVSAITPASGSATFKLLFASTNGSGTAVRYTILNY